MFDEMIDGLLSIFGHPSDWLSDFLDDCMPDVPNDFPPP